MQRQQMEKCLRILTEQSQCFLLSSHQGQRHPGHLQRRHEGATHDPGDLNAATLCGHLSTHTQVNGTIGNNGTFNWSLFLLVSNPEK